MHSSLSKLRKCTCAVSATCSAHPPQCQVEETTLELVLFQSKSYKMTDVKDGHYDYSYWVYTDTMLSPPLQKLDHYIVTEIEDWDFELA